VHEIVGRINGAYGTISWTPISLLVGRNELYPAEGVGQDRISVLIDYNSTTLVLLVVLCVILFQGVIPTLLGI